MAEGQIFNAMVAFFDEDDWEYNSLEGLPILSLVFAGKSGKWVCYAQAREEQHQFVFYSVCPVNAPPNRRAAAAEFITRANYGMIIGNFEMDYDDGEIRYKTSLDVEGIGLTAPLAKHLVYANVIIMDQYLPGILAVIYGNSSPQEEIKKIEAGHHPFEDDDDDEPEFPEEDDPFDLDELAESDLFDADEDDEDERDSLNGHHGSNGAT
jgi:hypothetical protein